MGSLCRELVTVYCLMFEINFVWVRVEGEHHFVQNVTFKLVDDDVIQRDQRLSDIDCNVYENPFENAELDVGKVVDV